MSRSVYVPIQGERELFKTRDYLITNYRYIQRHKGPQQVVSIPLFIVKEYKLARTTAMFKVINGIINLLGRMPKSEELRAAFGLREFENLNVGDRRRLCEMSGISFVHPNHPYNRWCTVGYHRPFSLKFYKTYAWIRGEEVFTYWPDSFILTNYRLYQYDAGKRKLYLFPMDMVQTFESRRNKLKIQATTGYFEIKGTVPRQDHLLRVWQKREWESIPQEHRHWLLQTFDAINMNHPLSQYAVSDTAKVEPTFQVKESTEELAASAETKGGGAPVYLKPVIKNKCVNCGAPMTWESIDWVGPDQYACPSCGHAHTVDYVKF